MTSCTSLGFTACEVNVVRSEWRRRPHHCPQIQALSRRDEGSMVDSNLSVLRNRMEIIRIKERLQRCLRVDQVHAAGWNYQPICDYKYKKSQQGKMGLYDAAIIAGGTFGLTLLSGTLCLCLASVLVHLSQ